ncbi:MAG: peptidylprolyl isomerase, partial [bacterium]
RTLMQTEQGGAYSPRRIADDLSRLGMLGYQLEQFEARFGPEGVAIRLVASETDEREPPRLASIELAGGIPDVNRRIRAGLSQRPAAFPRRRRLDYGQLLNWDTWGIEAQYRGLGYLDARVREVKIAVADGEATVSLAIEAGERHTLGRITVGGAKELEPAAILKAIDVDGHPPWNEALRHRIRRRAAACYHDRGYLDAEADVAPKKREATVDVEVRITEGPRISLNHAVVRGAGEHEKKVAALIDLREGQTVTQPELDGLRTAIEDLGLFRRVDLALVPLKKTPEGVRDLVIEVEPIELGPEVTDAERLFYDAAMKLIRLYNQGERGLRSIRLEGFVVFGGVRLGLDATVVRPDYARVALTLPGKGEAEPQQVLFYRKGDVSFVRLGPLGRGWRIPGTSAGLKLDVRPANREAGLPAQFDLAFGVFKGTAHSDVVVLGDRCPPAAAYELERARRFREKPPTLEGERTLVLPPADAGDGPVTLTLGADKLPERVTVCDADGAVTARLDVALNSAAARKEAPEARPVEPGADGPAGPALLAPILQAFRLPGAGALAEETAAAHPDAPVARAARGLVRLGGGTAGPGLDDLRAAAGRSNHPAYKLLLAETLIRGDRFDGAARLCRRVLEGDAAARQELGPADLLLAASLSPAAALARLRSGPPDYARRATIDAALANIGLGRHDRAASLANRLLAKEPADAQAAELLARAELGRGRPKEALAALAKPTGAPSGPEPDLYAALAHLWLGDQGAGTRALARAMKASRAARNLVRLQERAARIHPRFKPAAAQAELAAVFSRAALGELGEEERAGLAAIVNDVRISRDRVERVAKRGDADPEGDGGEEVWSAARRQAVENALIVRWAVWQGLGSRPMLRQVDREIAQEMEELGASDLRSYARALEERGTSPAERQDDIFRRLLKRAAFAAVLADKVLVRPAEIRAYYENHPDEVRSRPAVTFRMITLHYVRYRKRSQAVALAKALRRRLAEQPDTFAERARQYSHDQRASAGGLWEDVERGRMLQPLDAAIFRLEPGEISQVIQTDRACHLVKLEKRAPPRKLSLAEAAGPIARAMQEVAARREIARWLRRLKARSYIELMGPAAPPAGRDRDSE